MIKNLFPFISFIKYGFIGNEWNYKTIYDKIFMN